MNRDPKGKPIALVVNSESKVEQRALVLDRAIDDKWLVTQGLAPGERVIVEGAQNVRPGAPVKAVEFVPASPAGTPSGAAKP